jgi:hypothetical protein
MHSSSSEGNASKQCPDCGQVKPQSEFGRNSARPDGLSFYCRPCFRARDNAAYRNRRLAAGAVLRERAQVGPGEKQCARCREVKPLASFDKQRRQAGGYNCYCKSCRSEMARAAYFQKQYGITVQELEHMVAEQGGLCAICRTGPAEHLDHDHRTGQVRRVLCFPCNGGLGQFRDDPELLRRAIDYLETPTWQRTLACTAASRLTSLRLAPPPSPTSSA